MSQIACARTSPTRPHVGRAVRNQAGTSGGLFVDRIAALRFALLENGNRPQAVIMVPGGLELDLG